MESGYVRQRRSGQSHVKGDTPRLSLSLKITRQTGRRQGVVYLGQDLTVIHYQVRPGSQSNNGYACVCHLPRGREPLT